MRLRLRFLGCTVWSLTLDSGSVVEMEEDSQGITGGSSLYTERDLSPPDPSNEEPWYEEERGFGFR